MSADVIDAIAPLPRGYADLLDRVRAAVEQDERVRALWLAGSVGRRAADAGSDLDVVVTVADETLAGFAAGWRAWLDEVVPVLLARELPGMPGSFYSVTDDCLRLDVVVEGVADIATTTHVPRVAVVDRDGLVRRLPDPSVGARGPDAATVMAVLEEFFRQQAIFPAAVVARRDWLLGVVGVTSAQQLLYRLFVESNQPLPAMGVKQWSSRLTSEQRHVLEALPVPQPRSDEVVAAMFAVRRAMLTHGRATAERCGASWPSYLDEAVAAYYASELGSPSGWSASTSDTTRADSSDE